MMRRLIRAKARSKAKPGPLQSICGMCRLHSLRHEPCGILRMVQQVTSSFAPMIAHLYGQILEGTTRAESPRSSVALARHSHTSKLKVAVQR